MHKKSVATVVTGGLGFIGTHLVRNLLSQGFKVIVFDDLSNHSEQSLKEFTKSENFKFHQHDISEPLPNLKGEIEIVYHLAALVSVPDSFNHPLRTHQVNETGFINVLEFCKNHRVKKLVYASSCAVYGSSPNLPLAEAETVVPESPYGLTKLNNEYYARFFHQENGLESIGLRFFNVYGPGQKAPSPYAGVISIFMDKIAKNEAVTIYGDGSQTRDFVYVKDIVAALICASKSKEACAVYNVGTQESTSVNKLYETIAKIAGSDVKPNYAQARLGDVQDSLANKAKLAEKEGFEPQWSNLEGLEALYQSYCKFNKS